MSNFQLAGFTFAPIDVRAMVQFCNSVFACDLQPFAALGTTLYRAADCGAAADFLPE